MNRATILSITAVVDPRISCIGGAPAPDTATFHKFVCQNERIGTLAVGGGGGAPVHPSLDPPLHWFN